MTDPDYSERMSLIISVLLSVETDLRGDALDFLCSTKWMNLNLDSTEAILGRMATRHAGLRLFAEAQGIDFAELEACGPPRHPSVSCLIEYIAREEDANEAEELADRLLKFVTQDS